MGLLPRIEVAIGMRLAGPMSGDDPHAWLAPQDGIGPAVRRASGRAARVVLSAGPFPSFWGVHMIRAAPVARAREIMADQIIV